MLLTRASKLLQKTGQFTNYTYLSCSCTFPELAEMARVCTHTYYGEQCSEDLAPLWSRVKPASHMQALPAVHLLIPTDDDAPFMNHSPPPSAEVRCRKESNTPQGLLAALGSFMFLCSSVSGNFPFNKHFQSIWARWPQHRPKVEVFKALRVPSGLPNTGVLSAAGFS